MNPMLDSREGYTEEDWQEYEAYLDGLDNSDEVWYDEDDGQPSEYTEWQDVFGGDDNDF